MQGIGRLDGCYLKQKGGYGQHAILNPFLFYKIMMASDYWEEKFWRDAESLIYLIDWSGMVGSALAYLNLPEDAPLGDTILLAIIFAGSAVDAFLRIKYKKGIIERFFQKLDSMEESMWKNLKKLSRKLREYCEG